MSLIEQTKNYIEKSVRWFYAHAIEAGAAITEVEYIGMHLYKIRVGNLELTYMGTVEGKANVIGASGEVF